MIDIKVERRIEYDDDLVIVKNKSGEVEYKGLDDYNPYRDEPWKYDSKNDVYTLPDGHTMRCVESKKRTEAYERKSRYILHDIITVAKCNSLDDIGVDDLYFFNPKLLFYNIKSTGDDAKLEAIEKLIRRYDYYSKEDDEDEDLYNKASKVQEDVIKIFEDYGFDWTDLGQGYLRFNTPEDVSLDQLLDFFESKMKIRLFGMGRGGSWTSINYKTDTGVEIQIGYAGHDKNYKWQFNIYGLTGHMSGW